jgi:peptidoglycan/xylan/chitin deacetylase (PgdA/CDA1 family)/GT2 family glycosyltransferase
MTAAGPVDGPGPVPPRLSVVIPSFDRREALRRCLEALGRQTADPAAFEVVVVLDGSTDGSAEMLAGLRPRHALRVERKPNGGVASARNRGLELAAAPVVLFLDDDIVATPGLVEAHLRAHEEGEVMAMGPLELRLVRRPDAVSGHFLAWWTGHYARLASGERALDASACYSGNLSVPVAVARAAGGFDATMPRSEDVEFGQRVIDRGTPFVYAPDAVAVQDFDKDGRDLVRDWDRAGTVALELYRRHPSMARSLLLGGFDQGSGKAVLARRALLALRPSPQLVAALAVRLPRRAPPGVFGLAQSYLLWRGVRRSATRDEWRRLTRGTVILMYHAIGRPGERASRYVLPAPRFRRQLAWLRLRRRPLLSLDDYVRLRRAHADPPAGAVVVTFDDGYDDNLELAAPALRRRRVPATLFLVSGRMGETNAWTAQGPLAGRPLATWDAARAALPVLAAGAHTRTHPRLTELEPAAAEQEVAGSRADLERALGTPVEHFAYPYGKRSPEVEAVVRRAGFASACGTVAGMNGPATSLFDLRRLEVVGTTRLWRFALELWLGRPLTAPRGS